MQMKHNHVMCLQAVETRFLTGVCGVKIMDSESNEIVCGRSGMSSYVDEMNYGVVEMKHRI